uniref:Uncharacterized protein n=2 Tax=Candidatus Kentrum sp. FW TaxID=2126338 RepID=A0A450TKY3_9GAMM|nr:MAG: hypothetical protein BECKFW1821C_GA0114237_101423 [Candidatus Kentron sp. FW]
MRIPVKSITDSGIKPITQTGEIDHLSERSDARILLLPEVIVFSQICLHKFSLEFYTFNKKLLLLCRRRLGYPHEVG